MRLDEFESESSTATPPAMQTTGMSGWARPDQGFSVGRGGGSSQLGLPLVSRGASRTGGADPKIHSYNSRGVTGTNIASVSGPAYLPPSTDGSSLPLVPHSGDARSLTATDYGSIAEKKRYWGKDQASGAFCMLEGTAPRQPPISARLVDSFASTRDPRAGPIGPTGRPLQQVPSRAASCEPAFSEPRPFTSVVLEQWRRLGRDLAPQQGVETFPHAGKQLDIPLAPANGAPRPSVSPYGRVTTLKPRERKQLPSVGDAKADRDARRKFHQDMNAHLEAFSHASPHQHEPWMQRRDDVVAAITARAEPPFTALPHGVQQTLATAARLAERQGALFNLDAERAVVLARGIGDLDAQQGCGGQLPRAVRRIWSGHGPEALHEDTFADLDINAECRRLVNHLLSAVAHIYPGRGAAAHSPGQQSAQLQRRSSTSAASRSSIARSRQSLSRRATASPVLQQQHRRLQTTEPQRFCDATIPTPMRQFPLEAENPRASAPQDWWDEGDKQELRELASRDDLGFDGCKYTPQSPHTLVIVSLTDCLRLQRLGWLFRGTSAGRARCRRCTLAHHRRRSTCTCSSSSRPAPPRHQHGTRPAGTSPRRCLSLRPRLGGPLSVVRSRPGGRTSKDTKRCFTAVASSRTAHRPPKRPQARTWRPW